MTTSSSLFFKLWLRHPLQIAAVCPSSSVLARTLGGLADLDRAGTVLELGAGTGSLTAGLLEAGCTLDRLVALEFQPHLIDSLHARFPGIRTIAGDATQLENHLRQRDIGRLAAVVSSLPIKWFSVEAQRAVVQPCLERLGNDGCLLQITNAFVSPISCEAVGVRGYQVARVWRNVPPVQIWAYYAT